MKCEEIIKLSVYFEGKELNPEEVCGGEMEEKGRIPIEEFGIVIGTQTLYQCKSCKTIKIC